MRKAQRRLDPGFRLVMDGTDTHAEVKPVHERYRAADAADGERRSQRQRAHHGFGRTTSGVAATMVGDSGYEDVTQSPVRPPS